MSDSKNFGVDTVLPHDCHVHMALDGSDFRVALKRHEKEPDEAYIRSVLASYADAGYAYLRDGGDHCDAGWTARNLAREYGIEYASPVFAIYEEGSYGSMVGRSFSTMEEYKTLVDEVAQRGGDFIKIMLSGILDFNDYGKISGFTPSEEFVYMMIEYAHARGFAVMAHVNGARAIQLAVEAGVDSVEHGFFSDRESRIALANSNTIWVPTFAPIGNLIGTGIATDDVLERIKADQIAAVREVADMGGLIALGSDAGANSVPHVQAARYELSYMQEALGESWIGVLTRGFDHLRTRFGSRIA